MVMPGLPTANLVMVHAASSAQFAETFLEYPETKT
jgi:hypothetical protein